MEWTKGGVWQLNKRMLIGDGPVEYKYVMTDKDGGIHWWEKDPNHQIEVCAEPHPSVTHKMSKFSYLPRTTSTIPSDDVSVLYNCRDRYNFFSSSNLCTH